MERGVASEASDLGGLGIAPREFEVDHMDSAPHLKKKETWYKFSFVFKFIFPSLFVFSSYLRELGVNTQISQSRQRTLTLTLQN